MESAWLFLPERERWFLADDSLASLLLRAPASLLPHPYPKGRAQRAAGEAEARGEGGGLSNIKGRAKEGLHFGLFPGCCAPGFKSQPHLSLFVLLGISSQFLLMEIKSTHHKSGSLDVYSA